MLKSIVGNGLKKWFFIFFFFLIITELVIFIEGVFSAGVDSPIAHWNFEEGTGSISGDISGNFFTGSLINSPTWTTDSAVGSKAINFSGTNSGTNQYIDIAHNNALIPSSLSISAWIKLETDPTSNEMIIKKNNSISPDYTAWKLYVNTAKKIMFQIYDGTTLYSIDSDSVISLDSWYHVVAILNGTGTTSLYINNIEQSNHATGASITTLSPGLLRIGAGNQSTNQFHGSIDDVRLYNEGLTGSDVSVLYSLGGTGPEIEGLTLPTTPRDWVEDQPTTSRITTQLNTNIDDRPFPRVSLGPVMSNLNAQQLSKYDLVAGKPSRFSSFATAQTINSNMHVLRILAPQAYQGWDDPACSGRNGIPFDNTAEATSNCNIFAGHWLYEPGTTLNTTVNVSALTLSVADASKITAGIYAVIYEGGSGSFTNAEHVMVESVNTTNNTITLSSRGYKSTARSHGMGSIIASHVKGNGDSGDQLQYNWVYNLSTTCPVDSNGKKFNQAFAERLVSNYNRDQNENIIPNFRIDGILYDADFQYTLDGDANRLVDANNDLILDQGFSNNGENWWGNGLEYFYNHVRELLPDTKITLGGDAHTFGYDANVGTQFEGYPSRYLDRGVAADYTRTNWYHSMVKNQIVAGVFGPRINDFNSRIPTKLYPNGATTTVPRGSIPYVPDSNSPFRFGFGMATIYGGWFSTENWATSDPWYDEFSVDVTPSSPTYGHAIASNSTNESQVREHLGWLGMPTGPYKRLYDSDIFSSSNNLFPNGGFESSISGWTTANTSVSRVTNRSLVGGASLYIAEQTNYSNDLYGAWIKGPSVSLTAGAEATVAFSVYSPISRSVQVMLGSESSQIYIPSGWSKQVFGFKVGSGGSHQFRINCGLNQSELWIDEIYIHQADANVFRRDFDNGIVIVNATETSKTINLQGTFQRIQGTGQDAINDGSTVNQVTIGAYDSAILVREDGDSVPSAPTIGTATGSNASATVSFTAPANNGGSPITRYTVYSSTGAISATGTNSPITITGLTNGTSYTFTVKATNAIGQSIASSASNSIIPSLGAMSSLDPAGCNNLSDAELRSYGYEPVRAYGALGDDATDDTTAIQTAITIANDTRRVVYLHPGEYIIHDTLEFIQDDYTMDEIPAFKTKSNGANERFGQELLGSYCGTEKPTIKLVDGTAPQTNEAIIAAEPFPVVLFWRADAGATGPDDTDNGLDFNQTIKNVKIVLGNNPGAVGVRHRGAEGSSAQEVTVDARGGFAGFYNINSSGGYTYNVEVIGGKYGIYAKDSGGGAVHITGLKLSGQDTRPIAIGGYTPFGIVGFDIQHKTGNVFGMISGTSVTTKLATTFHDSSGHIYLVDGKIESTGGTLPIISNSDRSVYLKNVYFKGQTVILDNDATVGQLRVSNTGSWTKVGEFSYGGEYSKTPINSGNFGEYGSLLGGEKTDWSYYNGIKKDPSLNIIVSDVNSPESNLMSQHLYDIALCNVEASNNTFVTDYGANPNDTLNDSTAIQNAINAAELLGNRVFLPASSANASYALQDHYRINSTITLKEHTKLCGVTQYSSVLDASTWTPTVDSPVIKTQNSASSDAVIADFKIMYNAASGFQKNGENPIYNPHIYGILWQAGHTSISRDVGVMQLWGDPGKIKGTIISGSGGGKWYGAIREGGFTPPDMDSSTGGVDYPFRASDGTFKMSPETRKILIDGTTEALTFYPFHAQHQTNPKATLVEINNASNVTMYGTKSEMGAVPEKMSTIVLSNSADIVPIWMSISGASNISLIGFEGMPQTGTDRGIIEITNSHDITIASMGRRGNGINDGNAALPQNEWFFIKDDSVSGSNSLKAQGFVSLYKSDMQSGATTVPDAPTIGTAIGSNASATVSFTAPANNGGSPITRYTVYSNTGAITATGTSSPITITGLTNGTSYTFTVKATNAIGQSIASSASNTIIPSSLTHSISGTILHHNGVKIVSGITINLENELGDILTTTTTNASGSYIFSGVASGGNYIIRPIKNIDNSIEVTGTDKLKIGRHIVSLETLDSTYKIVSSDVNWDGSITGTDRLKLGRYIVGLDTSLLSGAWRFYDTGISLTLGNYRSVGSTRIITNLNSNLSSQNFFGVKMGDANNSW